MADDVPETAFLSSLTVDELYRIATENSNDTRDHLDFLDKPRGSRGFILNISPEFTIEEVGAQIDGEYKLSFEWAPEYWQALKKEFRILLCTNDKKYQKLRRNLAKSHDKAQLAIVSTISAAVASSVGVIAGALVPVCAMLLIAVLKLGKEAFCRVEVLDVKVGPELTQG